MAIGIILGIVFVVLAIVAGVAAFVLFDNDNTVGGTLCVVACIALVITFFIVPFSFKTVNSGEIAVVKHLGKVTDVKEPGTYYTFWMTNKYERYDSKVQNVELTTMAYSSDAQTMDVQMTFQYQIRTDMVKTIATQYGTLEALQSRIQSIVIEKTKSVLSSHKAMDIIANRAQMSPAVESAIKEAVGEEYCVIVTTVVLTNIDFSDAFELAVEEKMIAEQAKLKADYENQTKVAQAEAEAEAKLKAAQAEIDIAQAKADASLKQAQAQIEIEKAKAEALKIEAEAEAAANKIITESITQELLDKIIAENWDGELPVVVGNDGQYILPSDIFDKN